MRFSTYYIKKFRHFQEIIEILTFSRNNRNFDIFKKLSQFYFFQFFDFHRLSSFYRFSKKRFDISGIRSDTPIYNSGLDGHFCDVTLITSKDGRKFRAHRAVLCAVSRYFHALFLGSWRNTDKNEILLPGISDEILDILLGTGCQR